MTPTRARFAYDVLRSAVLTVAVGGALVTMTGHLDDRAGQTVGTATVQVGTVVAGTVPTFVPATELDPTQVEGGAPIRPEWHGGE